MKPLILAMVVLSIMLMLPGCTGKQGKSEQAGSAKVDMANDTVKFSYTLGLETGTRLHQFKNYLDMDAFLAGLKDTLLHDRAANYLGQLTEELVPNLLYVQSFLMINSNPVFCLVSLRLDLQHIRIDLLLPKPLCAPELNVLGVY